MTLAEHEQDRIRHVERSRQPTERRDRDEQEQQDELDVLHVAPYRVSGPRSGRSTERTGVPVAANRSAWCAAGEKSKSSRMLGSAVIVMERSSTIISSPAPASCES
jgi:hypothetical protein